MGNTCADLGDQVYYQHRECMNINMDNEELNRWILMTRMTLEPAKGDEE
ncbi:hypothetical protein [Vulcanisaeta moutnovskia]|nr:hypothetical protein [Vulcanisaeta moutnovskia]